jgi:Protein of unknown function (DUF3467)
MKHESDESQGADQREGHYANYFKVGHNAFEFLLDFGQFFPENGEVQFHTRIIIAPTYAKALFELLRGSIDQHEQTFGAIQSG